MDTVDSQLQHDENNKKEITVNNFGIRNENALKLNDIDDVIDELDTESSKQVSILSLGSDWSDEPQDDIGNRIHEIYYLIIKESFIQEKNYDKKVIKKKEKFNKEQSKQTENLITKKKNKQISLLPFSLFSKLSFFKNINNKKMELKDSKQIESNLYEYIDPKLNKSDFIELRNKTANNFLETYSMQSDLSMRDPQDFAEKTIKYMSDNGMEVPSKMHIIRTMLLYQTVWSIYIVSFSSSASNMGARAVFVLSNRPLFSHHFVPQATQT